MNNYDLYVLTCTECHNVYSPHHFRGQCIEFRMCARCQVNNPEIYNYLEKYIYKPQREKCWKPFQQRLDRVIQKCRELEEELLAYKDKFCNIPYALPGEDEAETNAQAEEMLNNLLQKCVDFEEEFHACKTELAVYTKFMKPTGFYYLGY